VGVLATKLAAPSRGAAIEVVQALCAAAIRAGLLEATYQGAKIGTPSDHRLDRVFGKLTDFRGTSFAPPSAGPTVQTRVQVAQSLDKLTGAKSPIDATGLSSALRGFFIPDSEICATISAGLRGADISVPDAVTRLQNVVASFRLASDADVITSAAAAWADLAADHDTVRKMADSLDEDLPLVRKARVEVIAGADGLPSDAVEACAELADLLAAGDLLTHRGRIKELKNKVADARLKAQDEAIAALTEKVQALRTALRQRFTDMDSGKVEEALRLVDNLLPSDSIVRISLADLRARLEIADTRSTQAAHVLEELQAAGNLARVYVSQIVAESITSEEELDVALERIRHAALAVLADGKQVRLQ